MMNKEISPYTPIQYLKSIGILTGLIIITTTLICLIGGWWTWLDYSNSFMYFTALLFTIGGLSLIQKPKKWGWGLGRDRDRYPQIKNADDKEKSDEEKEKEKEENKEQPKPKKKNFKVFTITWITAVICIILSIIAEKIGGF